MKRNALIGVILIVIGIIVLFYNQFSDRFVYKTEEKNIDVGPIHATSEREKTVPMTTVVGAIVIVAGVVYLFMRGRK